jgi:hypothetical protein
VVFGEIGEVGVVAPAQYLRPGDERELTNPFAPQVPHLQVRVWPAYDEAHAGNIDLIARAHRGRADAANERLGGAVDMQRILRLAERSRKATLRPAGDAVVLAAANADARPRISTKSDCRLVYRPALDLTRHRGIALTVEGDRSRALLCVSFGRPRPRDYVVPVGFRGTRKFQIPCGEASWVHPQWGCARGKWGRFDNVPDVSVYFGRMPARTASAVRIAGLQALKELKKPLRNPVFEAGDAVIALRGEVPTGCYLVYRGGESATVYDANWHRKAALPVTVRGGSMRTGSVSLRIRSDNAASGPWLQVRLMALGEPVAVD